MATPPNQWSEEGLAALLVRLLGIVFLVMGLISGIHASSQVWWSWRRWGWDDLTFIDAAMKWPRPVFEVIFGLYLIIGGRWVFNRLLAPIARLPKKDALDDVDQ